MFVHPLTPLLIVGIGMIVFEGNEMQIFTCKRFDYLIVVFLLALNRLTIGPFLLSNPDCSSSIVFRY